MAFQKYQKQPSQYYILDVRACRITKVGDEKFSRKKKSKLKILSYINVIYLKRKLRTCTIQIQVEKVQFPAKKNIFSDFFNFRVIFEAGKNFKTYIISNFFIRIKKMASLGPHKCWGDQSHKVRASLEQPPESHTRLPTRGGTLCPPPCRIGLKLAKII